MASADDTVEGLGGLSEAELEYAYRYADHLSLAERRPDPSGFDAERVAVIEQRLNRLWHAATQRLKRRARR